MSQKAYFRLGKKRLDFLKIELRKLDAALIDMSLSNTDDHLFIELEEKIKLNPSDNGSCYLWFMLLYLIRDYKEYAKYHRRFEKKALINFNKRISKINEFRKIPKLEIEPNELDADYWVNEALE